MQVRSGRTNNFEIISIVLLVSCVARHLCVAYALLTFRTNAVLNVIVTSLGLK